MVSKSNPEGSANEMLVSDVPKIPDDDMQRQPPVLNPRQSTMQTHVTAMNAILAEKVLHHFNERS